MDDELIGPTGPIPSRLDEAVPDDAWEGLADSHALDPDETLPEELLAGAPDGAGRAAPITVRLGADGRVAELEGDPAAVAAYLATLPPARGVAPADVPSRLNARPGPRQRRMLASALAGLLCLLLVGALGAGLLLLDAGRGGGATGRTATQRTATATATAAGIKVMVTPLPIGTLPDAVGLPTPTPQPTSRPGAPTPTPDPHARTATVVFTQASAPVQGPATLSACWSGCDVPLAGVTNQTHTATAARAATGGSGYWAVDILVTSTTGNGCSPCHFDHFTSSGNSCTNAPLTLSFPAGGSAWAQCQPSSVPVSAHDFSGTAVDADTGTVIGTLDNPGGSYWSGNPQVTSSDCSAAEGTAQSAAQGWLTSYGFPSGVDEIVNRTQKVGSLSCSPGPGASASSTTGSATATISWTGYKSADARSAAAAKLLAAIPSGWTLKGSPVACTNPNATWTGSIPFAINCQDTGTAAYSWTPALQQQLAQSLVAANSLSAALQFCNATAGVAAGTCQIQLTGGDGKTLPASAADVAVSVTSA